MDSNKDHIGEIVLLDFPFTNNKGSKLRPALVVGVSDDYGDLLVAYITSEVENYIWSEYAVSVKQSNLQNGIIKHESVIRCDKLITVNYSRIARYKVALLKKIKVSTL